MMPFSTHAKSSTNNDNQGGTSKLSLWMRGPRSLHDPSPPALSTNPFRFEPIPTRQPRFYEMNRESALEMARFPPGCSVNVNHHVYHHHHHHHLLTAFPNHHDTNNMFAGIVEKVYIDSNTNMKHYQVVGCDIAAWPLIPQHALSFGYGTTVWVRLGGSGVVAAQILDGSNNTPSSRTTALVVGNDRETNYYTVAALHRGVNHASIYRNVPDYHVVYRSPHDLRPLSRPVVVAPPLPALPTAIPTTTQGTRMATTSHEDATHNNPLFNANASSSFPNHHYSLESLTAHLTLQDEDNATKVPQIVEFSRISEKNPSTTTGHDILNTTTSPVTVMLEGTTSVSTTDATTTGTSSLPLSNQKKDPSSPPPPPSAAAAAATENTTTLKDNKTTTTSSCCSKTKTWATVACDFQSATQFVPARRPVVVVSTPDVTFSIPAWAVTPALQALFKKERPSLENKYSCNLDLSGKVKSQNENITMNVWTIGITYRPKYKQQTAKTRQDLSSMLWKALYELIFVLRPKEKDERRLEKHERLCLAYDFAYVNPHMYPPATKNVFCDNDKDETGPPIVWQNEGCSRSHRPGWITMVETGPRTTSDVIPILVGIRGHGTSHVKGDNTHVFVCVLESPRVGIFLVGPHVREVQQSLIRAQERIAWAKTFAPHVFGLVREKSTNDDDDDARP